MIARHIAALPIINRIRYILLLLYIAMEELYENYNNAKLRICLISNSAIKFRAICRDIMLINSCDKRYVNKKITATAIY